MSEMFIAGGVSIDSSHGRGTVHLIPAGLDGSSIPVAGAIRLEGPWVHVARDSGDERSFPVTQVLEIAWTERRVS